MRREAVAGPGRRWLLLAALLWALGCSAAGSGGRRRAASLGEMLREVEALMEDTQHKLRNAVQEVRGGRGFAWGNPKGWSDPSSLPRSRLARTCGQRPLSAALVDPVRGRLAASPPLRRAAGNAGDWPCPRPSARSRYPRAESGKTLRVEVRRSESPARPPSSGGKAAGGTQGGEGPSAAGGDASARGRLSRPAACAGSATQVPARRAPLCARRRLPGKAALESRPGSRAGRNASELSSGC